MFNKALRLARWIKGVPTVIACIKLGNGNFALLASSNALLIMEPP